jgi:serine/threonine protein kinase
LLAVPTISHFEVLEKLGQGGMGVVWKARDMRLERIVALKLLPAEKTADTTRRLRFMQEARAASALNHPHIITIYDIDREDGADFIAMEFVPGRTLDQLIRGKGLRVNEALKYAIQIADALAAAHAAGIVHRDLKPGNVMVTEKGDNVKVLDFGLAKLQENTPISQADNTRTLDTAQPKTVEGTILGTAAYMSPEQAEGKNVDARSDIFSFGAVLYEMLTGRRAFQGHSTMATLAAILNREPEPVESLAGAIPVELARLVRRCLRKDPDRRAQSMQDLKLALEDLKEAFDAGTLATAAVQSGKPAGHRKKWAALAFGVVLLAAIGWFAMPWSKSRPGPAGPPVIVLMDTTAPNGVYDPDTRQKSGTNADDISDDLRDLPVVIHKETVGATWNREDQILKQIPDLIVVHLSAFVHAFILDFQSALPPVNGPGNLSSSKASPPQPYRRNLTMRLTAMGQDKLEAFLGYVGASNPKTKVLLYSRGAPGAWAETTYRHEWERNLERRYPALRGRVFTINVEGGHEKASFRAPETVAQVRQTVRSILKLQ